MKLGLRLKHSQEQARQIVDIACATRRFSGGEQLVARIEHLQRGLIARMSFLALVQEWRPRTTLWGMRVEVGTHAQACWLAALHTVGHGGPARPTLWGYLAIHGRPLWRNDILRP
jgi:hypothetical protein